MKGYKGFKKGLISSYNQFQYKEGETYKWEPESYWKEISLCNRGFHFSSRISDAFKYYKNNEENVFAIVEATGKILTGEDKSCTDEITVIKVLSKAEVEDIYYKENEEFVDNEVYCLSTIKHLQDKYNFSIGGSTALFINGINLFREKGTIDFDVVMPFYQKILPDEIIEGCEEFDGKTSGNDFTTTFALTTKDGKFLKLDVRIKPEQKYELVEYKGVEYKTSDIFTIIEAKARYAMEGNYKHKTDILKMLKIGDYEEIKGDEI